MPSISSRIISIRDKVSDILLSFQYQVINSLKIRKTTKTNPIEPSIPITDIVDVSNINYRLLFILKYYKDSVANLPCRTRSRFLSDINNKVIGEFFASKLASFDANFTFKIWLGNSDSVTKSVL